MRAKTLFTILLFGLITNHSISQVTTIDYLGQTPPGEVPRIFAPGIVSVNNRYEYGLSVSPNGKEIFFSCEEPGKGLMRIVKVGDTWSSPQFADLRKMNAWEFEAFYTQTGDSLFFTSLDGTKNQFYFVTKTDTGWGEAKKLSSQVNDDDVMWCSFAANGNMYYTKSSDFNSYCSQKVNGIYQAGVKLTNGAHPYVSSDETYFLYNFNNDIYIRLKKPDGKTWGTAIRLNSGINTAYAETCPSLSPDEKYMFFGRYNDVGNKSNIYWVSTDFINVLKNSANSVNQTFEQNIRVSPNPATGMITIAFGDKPCINAVVKITNMEGIQIFSKNFQYRTAANIDLTGHPKGIYLLSLNLDGQLFHEKFCLE
jgi:hypothetical protein